MNSFEIVLSFLEGLALILSPCILPILPLVLTGSVLGGKKRPFGIIVGFIVSFTLLALLSRKLVMLFNIDFEIIKYSSLFLLTLFGLVLISKQLSNQFSKLTNRISNLGSNLTLSARDGFGSGVFIGMLIGLIWTPCAGPIFASVLVQIIKQQSNFHALLIITAFAVGASIPMLIIALMGRKVMDRLKFFKRNSENIRKIFGVIILLSAFFIAFNFDPGSLLIKEEKASTQNPSSLQNGLKNPYPAPEFKNINAWLNSKPLTMQSLKGKVVLVDFWTYSCINCVRTFPYIKRWHEEYKDKGLVIIGVHSPEFEFEKNINNIKKALLREKLTYAIAVDNQLETFEAFKNSYWPAHYLINKDGKVVYTHFGEGHYAETENNIRYLLQLKPKLEAAKDPSVYTKDQTPETYLGSYRAERFTESNNLLSNQWSTSGKWKVEKEKIISEEQGAKIRLNFTAGKVFLVLGTKEGNPITVSLTLNGKPLQNTFGKDVLNGTLTVKEHTLYELINQHQVLNGLLEITVNSPGLEAYAFTFGN
ncbi:MAG: hypothetical protein RIQ48_840 [Pseudomonadota bacterium]